MVICSVLCTTLRLSADTTELEVIGATALRQLDPTLNGGGVKGAQAEPGVTNWEVNPVPTGHPQSFFTYFSALGSASTFPNNVGSESQHGTEAGEYFYGIDRGVAPGLNHLDNYEAAYFTNLIANKTPIAAKVVNQSLYFDEYPRQQIIDSFYDNYAARFNTLFVTGAGNSGAVYPPSTCYNGICVSAYGPGSFTAVGPTADNGRSKPDITVPVFATSYSTPFVSGSAAVLVQAGTRGDGGVGTSAAAVDTRTVKALLLNGAIKPPDWTNSMSAPLHFRHGAGILNVFNSYKQLRGGKHSAIETTSVTIGGAHPPGNNQNSISAQIGWDFATISNVNGEDKVAHYYFNLANSATLTATLVWNRQENQNAINDLDFFLYDSHGSLVKSSVSLVDNVEHLYAPGLLSGRYDLQVMKKGGASKWITETETYALAFEFASSLSITRSGNDVVVSWPTTPTGFILQSTTNLNPAIFWSDVGNTTVSNNFNTATLNASAGRQFFRLYKP